MKQIESTISSLVKTQFPEFYVTEGPRFVDFVQQYYVWMESQNQAINRSRSLFDYRDIDKTSSEFISHYKNKFLSGFPLTSEANTQFLIKHATDIYGTKGTSTGIELTMQALFNDTVRVQYPSDNLFKTSDGIWVVPVYLELSESSRTKNFIGKQIRGSASGATAFMEALVTKRVDGKRIQVAYLSTVVGDFQTSEQITSVDDTNLDEAPVVIGSMTTLTIQQGGANFAVGDIFDVVSQNGQQGKARITSINNQTGKVNFIFIDALHSGGWGYSLDHSQILIAQKMLEVTNVQNANTQITGFYQFEGLTQNFAGISYNTARPDNSNYAVGAVIENYYANGAVAANAVIVSVSPTNNTSGSIVVAPYSGNVAAVDTVFAIRGTGTLASFNANSGVENTTEFITTLTPHTFSNGDIVIYSIATGNTALSALSVGAAYCIINANTTAFNLADTPTGPAINLTAGLNETGHKFRKTLGSGLITSYADRSATATIMQSNAMYVGVVNISSNGFISTPYANVVGAISNTVATVANTSTGTGATFSIGYLTDTETVLLSPDFLHSNNTQNVQFSTINLNGNNSGASLQYGGTSTSTFNANSGVANSTRVITTTSTHSFVNSNPVVYRVSTGNTVLSGLSNNSTYYVVNASSTTFQLSTTITPLVSRFNALTNVSNTTNFITPTVYASTFNANSGVANTTEYITTTTAHNFSNGDIVVYTVSTGNTTLTGLTNNTSYFILNANSTAFQLANSYTSSAINITAGLSESGHTLTHNHLLVNNNIVTYSVTPGNTVIAGLTNNASYYVINANTTQIQLASTANGAAIAVTSGVSEAGHYLTSILPVAAGLNQTGHNLNKAHHALSTGDGVFGGFGFVKYPASTADAVLLDCLRFDSTIIGSIASLTSRSTGQDYNVDPFVVVLDPYTFGYQKHDYLMNITPLTGAFVVGEQILQTFDQPAIQLTVNNFTGTAANGTSSTTVLVNEKVYQSYANGVDRAVGFVVEAGISGGNGTIKLANVSGTFVTTSNSTTQMKSLNTGGTANISLVTTTTLATTARGIVKEAANSSFLKLKRINLESTFGVGNTIIGQVSGSTATIVNFDQDFTVPAVGVNANIVANVQTAKAVASSLSVYDSGFGYISNETVTLTKQGSDFSITAIVGLGKQGKGAGYYSTTNGFLSSDKKLHDNDYYQEYSYEVISKIPFDNYIDVLKQITHVAGTKAFGRLEATSFVNTNATIINSIVIS